MAVRYGVYATPAYLDKAAEDPRLGHALQVAGAMLSTRIRPVVASHESAARIHGLDLLHEPPTDLITLTRPPGSGTARGPRTRYVAARLFRRHVTTCLGVPVTTPARTVIDLARSLPFMDGVVVADSALHLGVATKADLAAVLGQCPQWRGADQARRVVEFSDGRAESVLESCARVVFERNGLEPPELQVWFDTAGGSYRVDFYWPKYRTIAEADGKKKYTDPSKAIAQLKRDEHLRGTGEHVLHFTWGELFGQEKALVARLEETFATPPPPPRRRPLAFTGRSPPAFR